VTGGALVHITCVCNECSTSNPPPDTHTHTHTPNGPPSSFSPPPLFPALLQVHFYKTLKWLTALPFLLMAGALLFLKRGGSYLPGGGGGLGTLGGAGGGVGGMGGRWGGLTGNTKRA
jgi:hypothetical protein